MAARKSFWPETTGASDRSIVFCTIRAEDEILTESVQGGLASGAYTQGILSSKEVVLAGFQDWIRRRLPVTRLVEAPAKGTVAERNSSLAG